MHVTVAENVAPHSKLRSRVRVVANLHHLNLTCSAIAEDALSMFLVFADESSLSLVEAGCILKLPRRGQIRAEQSCQKLHCSPQPLQTKHILCRLWPDSLDHKLFWAAIAKTHWQLAPAVGAIKFFSFRCEVYRYLFPSTELCVTRDMRAPPSDALCAAVSRSPAMAFLCLPRTVQTQMIHWM